MASSANDTRIPVSKTVRRELRVQKAQRDMRSYDQLLRSVLGVHEDGE